MSDFHFAKYRQNKHYHLKVLLSGFYSVDESKDFIHRPKTSRTTLNSIINSTTAAVTGKYCSVVFIRMVKLGFHPQTQTLELHFMSGGFYSESERLSLHFLH